MPSGPGPYVISCRYTGFSETEGMYMYTALNRIGSETYHGDKHHPGALLLERTYWEIGGERERGSRAPGN